MGSSEISLEDCDLAMESSFQPTSSNRVTDILFSQALLKCGGALLKKSQKPNMKVLKKKAISEIIDYILIQKGFVISEQQVLKKLNNMKNRVKVKIDRKKTGNIKINLNEGEKVLYEMMGAEENPSVQKISYGVSAGVAGPSSKTIVQIITASVSASEDVPTHNLEEEHNGDSLPKRANGKRTIVEKQTDPNKMDIQSLQRHVLLKQLEMFEDQKKTLADLRSALSSLTNYVTKNKSFDNLC